MKKAGTVAGFPIEVFKRPDGALNGTSKYPIRGYFRYAKRTCDFRFASIFKDFRARIIAVHPFTARARRFFEISSDGSPATIGLAARGPLYRFPFSINPRLGRIVATRFATARVGGAGRRH
jgi:hypothetical protein